MNAINKCPRCGRSDKYLITDTYCKNKDPLTGNWQERIRELHQCRECGWKQIRDKEEVIIDAELKEVSEMKDESIEVGLKNVKKEKAKPIIKSSEKKEYAESAVKESNNIFEEELIPVEKETVKIDKPKRKKRKYTKRKKSWDN